MNSDNFVTSLCINRNNCHKRPAAVMIGGSYNSTTFKAIAMKEIGAFVYLFFLSRVSSSAEYALL